MATTAGLAGADSNTRVEQYIESSPAITTLPAGLTPALSSLETSAQVKAAQGSSWIKLSCAPQYSTKIASHPVPCWYGDPHGVKTIALYGDSNAGNWIPALNAVARLLKYRLAVFAFPSCATPFIAETKTSAGAYYPIPFKGSVYGPVWQQCANWHAAVGPAIAALKPSAVIAVSGPWMYSSDAADLKSWIGGFSSMFAATTKGSPSAKRILLGTSPIMTQNVPVCISEHPTAVQACTLSYALTTSNYYGGILLRDTSIATAMRATLIPVAPLFCYNLRCSPVVKNYVVYVDQDHTTIAYSTYLEGLLYSDLDPLLH